MTTKIMKIKANEELFNRWKNLHKKFNFTFAAEIVQNNIEINLKQYVEWYKTVSKDMSEFIEAFNVLLEDTDNYVHDTCGNMSRWQMEDMLEENGYGKHGM